MRLRSILAALLLAWPGSVLAEAEVVASFAGSFEPATALSPDDDVDQIAALEQQAWREFRWEVLAPGHYQLRFEVADLPPPEGWPEGTDLTDTARASLHVSADGESFTPLDNGVFVAEGQFLSVLVAQKTEELEGGAWRFYPATWQLELLATVAAQGEAPQVAPILLPLTLDQALGCHETGCGEPGAVAKLPATTGGPDPDAPSLPLGAASDSDDSAIDTSADTALATELQTELARLGCYDSGIDGLWGPGSRAAMRAFNAATGSDLPVESPTPRALAAAARQTGTLCP